MYQSNGNPNKFKLVIKANRSDTTFNQITFTNGQEGLSSYLLENTVIDPRNKNFEIEEFEKLDTLKFYIKRTHIQTSDIGKYFENKITLEKEPLDSILYIKK